MATRQQAPACAGKRAGGEAKDVLEGLAAYLQGRRSYYETLQNLHTALAYITYATGRTGVEDAPVRGGAR